MGKCRFCPFFLPLPLSFLSRRYRRHGCELRDRRSLVPPPCAPRSASGLTPPRARSPKTGTRRFPTVAAIARVPYRPRGCSALPRHCRPGHATSHARPWVRSHCWPPSALSPLSSPSLGTTHSCPVEPGTAGCRALARATIGYRGQAIVGQVPPLCGCSWAQASPSAAFLLPASFRRPGFRWSLASLP